MPRLVVAAALLVAFASAAAAQEYEGNWDCKAADGTKAGLLTIYNPSYGYASPVVNDPASGTGSVTPYTDGVGFADGNLKDKLGITAGRLVESEGGPTIQLESQTAVLMICKQR